MSHSVLDDWKKKVIDATDNSERLKAERTAVYRSVQDMAKADAITTDKAIAMIGNLDKLITNEEKVIKEYTKKIETSIIVASRYK